MLFFPSNRPLPPSPSGSCVFSCLKQERKEHPNLLFFSSSSTFFFGIHNLQAGTVSFRNVPAFAVIAGF